MAVDTLETSLVRDVGSLSTLEWAAVVLAAATGAIHLYLGVVESLPPFVLATVGFALGIVVFFTRYWRRWFYLVAAAFAAVQVVLWVASGMNYFQLGLLDKVVQVLFVAVTLSLYRSR